MFMYGAKSLKGRSLINPMLKGSNGSQAVNEAPTKRSNRIYTRQNG